MAIVVENLFRAPSLTEWLRFAEILAGIAGIMVIGEAVRSFFRWPPEFTRKLVHISVAVLIFFAPNLLSAPLPALLLGAVFTLFAYGSIKLGLLKSLHSVSRGAYGTVYYPLAFLLLVILFWDSHPEIVSLSMLALGLGDASAAIVGESLRNPTVYHLTRDKKSIQGSVAMFATTSLGLWAGLAYFDGGHVSGQMYAVAILGAATVATAWEALSSRALDNLTIPLSVAFVLFYVLVPSPMRDIHQFATGVILGVGIAVVAYVARFLKPSGSVATFLLASFVYGVGGWQWTVPILAFFVLSSVLSKAGTLRKREMHSLAEKSDVRDAGQVAANGGVAGILVLAQYLLPNFDFYPLYLGAVAAVTADTWGTEIGTYFRTMTVSIATFRSVPPGESGGVSLVGFFGAALGALVIAASSAAWIGVGTGTALVTVAGVAGSVADSLLGATAQAQYRCAVCGKNTERTMHCGITTSLNKGKQWLNNDAVNWACACTGAAMAFLFFQ